MMGRIFNIQRFSTHDGPGIRTTVFFKGCPLRCFWCQNPESQQFEPCLMFNATLCTGCGRCVPSCPNGAISIIEGKSATDRTRCIVCDICVNRCLNEARTIAGRKATEAEVMETVLRDRAVYKNSGGGVTLSGGDPTLQPEFAIAILQASKREGLHTAIETCGYVPWLILKDILEYTDLLIYDIKCLDTERHKKGTGVGNELILENALKATDILPMLVRMPLIPGFNDTSADVQKLVDFITDKMGLSSSKIELLQYNILGESKFELLGMKDLKPSLKVQSDEYFKSLCDIVANNGKE